MVEKLKLCVLCSLYKGEIVLRKSVRFAPSSTSNFFNYLGPAWPRAQHTRDIYAIRFCLKDFYWTIQICMRGSVEPIIFGALAQSLGHDGGQVLSEMATQCESQFFCYW